MQNRQQYLLNRMVNHSPTYQKLYRKAKSFYAVRAGFRTGIYDSWEECKKQTEGFKCAQYKKFSSLAEAGEWMTAEQQIKDITRYTTVYTDGSCRKNGSPDAVGGISIYFGDEDHRNVSEPYESNKICKSLANQRTELYAALYCLQKCR